MKENYTKYNSIFKYITSNVVVETFIHLQEVGSLIFIFSTIGYNFSHHQLMASD
jgi:hypothetical protein